MKRRWATVAPWGMTWLLLCSAGVREQVLAQSFNTPALNATALQQVQYVPTDAPPQVPNFRATAGYPNPYSQPVPQRSPSTTSPAQPASYPNPYATAPSQTLPPPFPAAQLSTQQQQHQQQLPPPQGSQQLNLQRPPVQGIAPNQPAPSRGPSGTQASVVPNNATPAPLPAPIFTRQSTFGIPYTIPLPQNATEQISEVRLFASLDQGKSWQAVDAAKVGAITQAERASSLIAPRTMVTTCLPCVQWICAAKCGTAITALSCMSLSIPNRRNSRSRPSSGAPGENECSLGSGRSVAAYRVGDVELSSGRKHRMASGRL